MTRPQAVVCSALLAAASLVAGCKRPSGAPQGAAAASASAASVQTEAVKEIEVPRILRLTGNLKGFRETDLAANAAGRVTSTSVERGATVTKGQALAQLDVRAAALMASEAAAQVKNIRTQEAQARTDCERYEKLRDGGAVSEAEYERVTVQCRTLPLTIEAAQARASLAAQNVGDGVIRAPFPGVITERYVEVGQYVRQDSRVVTIVSLDTLRLELAIPEAEVSRVTEGAEVTFTVAAYPEKKFSGKVRFMSGAVRPQTRDLTVEAVVENEARLLKPGMFADASLVVGSQKLPAVPRAAVFERDGSEHAFFVEGGRLEERVLSVGPEASGWVSVARGAKTGDRVCVGDLKALSNGQRVR